MILNFDLKQLEKTI